MPGVFGAIKNISRINTCARIVQALAISKLDYANSLLVGLPKCALRRLRVAQNSAVRPSSLCQGQIVLPYLALAKEPAKSRLRHCDLDSPQPINCQCEMPHHNRARPRCELRIPRVSESTFSRRENGSCATAWGAPMLPRSFRSPSVKQSLQDRTDIWRKVTI